MMSAACDSTHGMTGLSIFSAVTSGILLVTTIPLNGIILLCLLRDVSSNKAKYKLFFYKIIINIAIADLLKGLFGDTSALVWHIREAKGIGEEYKKLDVPFVHVSLFITDGVALVSMAILSMERILALLAPHFQFQKLSQFLILFASWPLSVFILLPYDTVGFLAELVIFFACTNTIAVVSLILLTSIYRYKFRAPYSRSTITKTGSITNSSTNLSSMTNDTILSDDDDDEVQNQAVAVAKKLADRPKTPRLQRIRSAPNMKTTKRRTLPPPSIGNTIHMEINKDSGGGVHGGGKVVSTLPREELCKADPVEISKIERTSSNTGNSTLQQSEQPKRKRKRSSSMSNIIGFAQPFQRSSISSSSSMRCKQGKRERKVTLAFLKMLLVFIFTYVPTLVMVIFMNLPERNCKTIHVLRDLSVLGILSSSLFRAINFLATLRHVRNSAKKLLRIKNSTSKK